MPASVTHVTVGTSPFTDLGRDTGEIAVLNSSDTATVYVKLGAAGTVKGANCYRIPPGSRRKIKLTTDGNTVVHHISTPDRRCRSDQLASCSGIWSTAVRRHEHRTELVDPYWHGERRSEPDSPQWSSRTIASNGTILYFT
jgi:hypothetical protein